MNIPSRTFFLRRPAAALALLFGALGATHAAEEKFVFLTNWYAQAEHGGFYQALATGMYKQAGLDVTIKMGGPNMNIMQLIAAGQADCVMGSSDALVLRNREQGVPVVTVAASMQKDPQGIVAHPGVKKIEELKDKTILISTGSYNTFWPWLKAKYGLADTQTRPYAFNLQPFAADTNVVQQGYVTYDPYAVDAALKFKPQFFLFSDYGWPNYGSTIICMEQTIKERPQAVAAFVKASMQGWKNYLTGDATAANTMIKKDNPNMTDGQIAFAMGALKERGLVMGGDAATKGIGIMTEERLKKTFDMMVEMKLIDPGKVDFKRTFTTQFVKDIKVTP